MMTRRGFFATSSLALAAAGCQSFTGSDCCSAKGCGKVKFKFGMAGYSCNRLSTDETLDLLKRLDMKYLCIKDFHLSFKSTDAQIAEFKQKCADHGVTGYGLGPVYMDTKEKARETFEFAKRVGVKLVVGVPFEMIPGAEKKGGGKNRRGSRSLLLEIEKLVKEFDIRYAIHNHGPQIGELFPDVEYGWNLIKDLDSRIGFCIDVGWEYGCDKDPAETIRKYGSRIYDAHIKNFEIGKPNGAAIPLPRGKIDLVRVCKAFIDVGYDGVCSLEYESFPPKGEKPGIKVDAVAESVGYFKGLMQALEG